MILPHRESIIIDADDFQFLFHFLIDLSYLRLRLYTRAASKIPEVEQNISVVLSKHFSKVMLLSLHVEQFDIDDLFAHL